MSKIPRLEVRSGSKGHDTEVICVFQKEGQKSAKATQPFAWNRDYAAVLQKLVKTKAFEGKPKTTAFVRFGGKKGAQHVLFVGFGPLPGVDAEKARLAGAMAMSRLKLELSARASVALESFEAKGETTVLTSEELVEAFAQGFLLASYQYEKEAAEPAPASTVPTLLVSAKSVSAKSTLSAIAKRVNAVSEAVTLTRDWSNQPPNVGTPNFYADEARRLGKEYGFKVRVLNEKDAKKEKMELFLAVAQGSDLKGRVVVLEYTPKKRSTAKTIAWVGKGVTFDSGGISLKPSARMEDMKHDMTGAATLAGAMVLAALLDCPNKIITVLGFTENMPSGRAITPGSVVRARNGKTVEIANTDAEGRLVLADLLDFANDLKPDVMINAATLTGAISVALGKFCCGLMGNDQELMNRLMETGERCGERIWQLPLYDEYLEEMKSDYADLKNIANSGTGGAIRGGIFLKQFVRPKTRWAHLDIACTAYDMVHLPYCPKKGASGTYVRSLARFALEFQ